MKRVISKDKEKFTTRTVKINRDNYDKLNLFTSFLDNYGFGYVIEELKIEDKIKFTIWLYEGDEWTFDEYLKEINLS